MDLPSLFNKETISTKNNVNLIIFDKNGSEILRNKIEIESNKRTSLKINSFLNNIDNDYGTFSIFHEKNPENIKNLGSFISDRGYVKYFINKLDIFKYVHGNLDAVSFDGKFTKNLGSNSFLKRNYNFQFKINKNTYYKFYVVNFTKKKQSFVLRSILNNKIIKKINLNPKGSGVLDYYNQDKEDMLSIKSNLVMSRPLVSIEKNNDIDFFHG